MDFDLFRPRGNKFFFRQQNAQIPAGFLRNAIEFRYQDKSFALLHSQAIGISAQYLFCVPVLSFCRNARFQPYPLGQEAEPGFSLLYAEDAEKDEPEQRQGLKIQIP
jgi:hypothetical protein